MIRITPVHTACISAACFLACISSMAAPGAEAPSRTVTLDDAQTRNIVVSAVQMRDFHAETSATGHIAFNEDLTTPVFAPWSGHVLRLLAKPGDIIAKGAPLIELDCPELAQAEADLWAAVPPVTKASAALEHARRNQERQQKLYEQQAVALKDWEQAQADTKGAESDLAVAQATLAAARAKLQLFGKDEADITRIESGRQLDRVIRIVAPLAGTITARKVGPGQFVRTDAADPLFTITDLSSLWMLADVYESDAPHVAVGQAVQVRLMALPGEVFTARIDYIAPAVDATTHRLPVRCVLVNPDRGLKSDMFASFTITTSPIARSPAVDDRAVVRDGSHQMVWVATAERTFAAREVATGLRQEGTVQIISGLAPNDRVVSDGALFLMNEQ
jgi:cobalt-zinc-cadmium efflux system membrane fusion protein